MRFAHAGLFSRWDLQQSYWGLNHTAVDQAAVFIDLGMRSWILLLTIAEPAVRRGHSSFSVCKINLLLWPETTSRPLVSPWLTRSEFPPWSPLLLHPASLCLTAMFPWDKEGSSIRKCGSLSPFKKVICWICLKIKRSNYLRSTCLVMCIFVFSLDSVAPFSTWNIFS